MILDLLKERFAIVAQQGNSAGYPANSPRALISAVPYADILMADVTLAKGDVLLCSHERKHALMSVEEAEDHDIVPLPILVEWAKETDKQLLLNPRTKDKFTLQSISQVAKKLRAEDIIAVVAHTLEYTRNVHAFNDKLGIVGALRGPDLYARFYSLGGHVGTLRDTETTPQNVRLVEAAKGRHRHPFLVLAPDAGIQNVYNACNGMTGASGIIMRDPETGREALQRRASTPACAGFSPD